MIEVSNLYKSYNTIKALKGINLKVGEGEIIGLLGPNGAGKTTLIKMLTGYLQPDSGDVVVDGLNVLTDTKAVQSRIGYLPENAPLYPELTVQSYLKTVAGLRQIPPDQELAYLSNAIHSTGLADRLTQPIGTLSKGYRQRVGLAQAILHKPRLLILDEPTVGLDPTQIVEIRHLIKRLAKNSTVLFSTHILPEVEALCDRVVILINGELKVDARLSELSSTNDALLTLDGDGKGVSEQLQAVAGVKTVTFERKNGQITYHVNGAEEVDLCPAIYHLAVKQGWQVRELRRDIQTLETVFNRLAISG